MKKLLLAGFVCSIAAIPAAAYARDGLQMAALPDSPQVEVIDSFQVLAVGTGILIGAAAGYLLIPFSAGMLVGAVAGGLSAIGGTSKRQTTISCCCAGPRSNPLTGKARFCPADDRQID